MFEASDTVDEIVSALGARLAQRRLSRRLTQDELAKRAGLSKRTVERLETAKGDVRLSAFVAAMPAPRPARSSRRVRRTASARLSPLGAKPPRPLLTQSPFSRFAPLRMRSPMARAPRARGVEGRVAESFLAGTADRATPTPDRNGFGRKQKRRVLLTSGMVCRGTREKPRSELLPATEHSGHRGGCEQNPLLEKRSGKVERWKSADGKVQPLGTGPTKQSKMRQCRTDSSDLRRCTAAVVTSFVPARHVPSARCDVTRRSATSVAESPFVA